MSDKSSENQSEKKGAELLDFWASWCGPCKIMHPVLEELKKEYGKDITLREIDVDAEENQAIVEQYHIMSVPTYIFIKDGEVVDHAVGVQSKDAMVKRIEKVITK